jgi:hypothetical protein
MTYKSNKTGGFTMNSLKKRWFFLASLIVLFVLSTTIFSFYQIKQMDKTLGVILPVPRALVPATTPAKIMPPVQTAQHKKKLVPDRPQDYGIVVLEKNAEPKTQADWDNFIHQESQQFKASASAETLKQRVKPDTQQIQQRLAQLDTRNQTVKAQLEKDPTNEELKAQLKHLMILRSLFKESE